MRMGKISAAVGSWLILAGFLTGVSTTQPMAMDSKVVKKDGPDLSEARKLIKAKNWQAALDALRRLEAANKPNADIYNLIGFASRKQGKFDESFDYYQRALKLEPNHLGANEYLGELFLQRGERDKAEAQAAILAKLCPSGCEERADLDEALAEAAKK